MLQTFFRPLFALSLLALPMQVVLVHAGNATQSYTFEVLLDQKPIGTHRFDLDALPDGAQRITSRADFEVRLLGIPLYRYQHQAEERWDGQCLTSIQATTRENGKSQGVRGERQADSFRLSQPVAAMARNACVTSYAYWNPGRLLGARELLNPQTGDFDAIRVEKVGSERIQWRGAPVMAQRYRLEAATHRIDLWYSESGEWLQLSSTAKGNRQVSYRRVD